MLLTELSMNRPSSWLVQRPKSPKANLKICGTLFWKSGWTLPGHWQEPIRRLFLSKRRHRACNLARSLTGLRVLALKSNRHGRVQSRPSGMQVFSRTNLRKHLTAQVRSVDGSALWTGYTTYSAGRARSLQTGMLFKRSRLSHRCSTDEKSRRNPSTTGHCDRPWL